MAEHGGKERKDWELKGETVIESTADISFGEIQRLADEAVANGGHLVIEGTGSGYHVKTTPVLTVVQAMPAPKKNTI